MGSYTNKEEDIAAQYLRESGYTILSRNDRRYGAEIDILAKGPDGETLYIFEVKSQRHPGAAFFPLVSRTQQSRLRSAALAIQAAAEKFKSMRICALVVNKQSGECEMVPDIVDFGL